MVQVLHPNVVHVLLPNVIHVLVPNVNQVLPPNVDQVSGSNVIQKRRGIWFQKTFRYETKTQLGFDPNPTNLFAAFVSPNIVNCTRLGPSAVKAPGRIWVKTQLGFGFIPEGVLEPDSSAFLNHV